MRFPSFPPELPLLMMGIVVDVVVDVGVDVAVLFIHTDSGRDDSSQQNLEVRAVSRPSRQSCRCWQKWWAVLLTLLFCSSSQTQDGAFCPNRTGEYMRFPSFPSQLSLLLEVVDVDFTRISYQEVGHRTILSCGSVMLCVALA